MIPGAEPTVYEEVPNLDKLTVSSLLHKKTGAMYEKGTASNPFWSRCC